ncbi:MAG: flippase-like domain-containing protein [Chloroflexi bacterium SZAS-1]|nr:flippase-like domain-containing protein [Chloroflexi bacterium SZAS-1]
MSTAPRKRRWPLTLLRVLVSGGLLIYLVRQAQPAQIWQVWRTINVPLLGLALLLQLAGIALSAAKWGIILNAQGQRLPFRWLFGAYLVGQFVGNVLPTTIGGDAMRAVQLGRKISSYAQAGASIFIERLTGFLALSLIANAALLAVVLSGETLNTTPALRWLALGLGVAAIGALLGAIAAPWLQRTVGTYLPHRVQPPLQRVAEVLAAYTPRGQRLALVLLMSLLFQATWVAIHAICGMALGIYAPLLLYALMVPLTDMIGLVPIFVNNLGARELIFTLYLGQIGVPPAQALALAFLVFTVKLAVSLLGGIVGAFGGIDLRAARAAENM